MFAIGTHTAPKRLEPATTTKERCKRLSHYMNNAKAIRREHRQRLRLERIRGRSKRIASEPSKAIAAPVPRPKSDYILPAGPIRKMLAPFLFYVRLYYDTDSYENCMKYIDMILDHKSYTMQLLVPYNGHYGAFTTDKRSISTIEHWLIKNRTLRWHMRHLIQRWRIARCKAMNTEDIVTCEPPVKLVTIYDWAQKAKYVFEAATLYRDFLTKIQNAVGFFIRPNMPRNPFTNAELTYGQTHFLVKALIDHGFSHWVLDAFKKSDYSVARLAEIYELPLKLDNLKNVFRRPTESECEDIVYEFIEDEYRHHDVEQPYKYGWRLAITEAPDTPIIQEWRALAQKKMELELRFDGIILESRMMQLHTLSLDIIKKPIRDIRRIWEKWADTLPSLIDTEPASPLEITIPEINAAYGTTIQFISREHIRRYNWRLDISSLNIMDYIRTVLEDTELGENDLSAIMVEDEDDA